MTLDIGRAQTAQLFREGTLFSDIGHLSTLLTPTMALFARTLSLTLAGSGTKTLRRLWNPESFHLEGVLLKLVAPHPRANDVIGAKNADSRHCRAAGH